jgi:hypothetical protein
MRQARILALFGAIMAATCASGQSNAAAQANPEVKLWAAVGVMRPMFPLSEAKTIQVSFAVVNDGQTTVDPRIGASHLYINGVEPNDWSFVINNGPRTLEFTALAPGRSIEFGYLLGPRYFAKPGIYRLRWEGANFKAPEIAFRVMP